MQEVHFSSKEEFERLRLFLEHRMRVQEFRGQNPNILNDEEAREALARYDIHKRPLLFVPQRYAK